MHLQQWLRWVVIAAFMATSPAWAHQQAVHCHETKVHCSSPSPQCASTLTVAVDKKGRLWRTFANGNYLYVQRRLSNGGFSSALAVNIKPHAIKARGENRPQMAFGPDNTLNLVWTIAGDSQYASNIRFAYAKDGQHFSQPVTINETRWPAMHSFPQLAVNDKGQIFIAWLDMRDMARAMAKDLPMEHKVTADVYYDWSTDGGEHFQAQDKRLKDAACLCCRMAMQLGANGYPELLFRDVYPGTERDHTLIRFAGVREPLPAKRISFGHWHLNGWPEQGPALLQVGDVTHFLWFDKGQLYYRQGKQGQLSPVFPVGKKGGEHPTMAAANGVLYRAWRRYSDGAMRIWWQVSKDQGHHWSKPAVKATTTGQSDYPQLVSQGQSVWLSWLTRKEGARLWNLTEGDSI